MAVILAMGRVYRDIRRPSWRLLLLHLPRPWFPAQSLPVCRNDNTGLSLMPQPTGHLSFGGSTVAFEALVEPPCVFLRGKVGRISIFVESKAGYPTLS